MINTNTLYYIILCMLPRYINLFNKFYWFLKKYNITGTYNIYDNSYNWTFDDDNNKNLIDDLM